MTAPSVVFGVVDKISVRTDHHRCAPGGFRSIQGLPAETINSSLVLRGNLQCNLWLPAMLQHVSALSSSSPAHPHRPARNDVEKCADRLHIELVFGDLAGHVGALKLLLIRKDD